MSSENPKGLRDQKGVSGLNPYNYQLDILTIVNNEGRTMDVRNMMGECRIYESITNNFLMGELAIIDAITPSMFEQLQFTGQESLRIKFRMGGTNREDSTPGIDQLFRIYKISDLQRQDQGQLMYKLSFCSPEFLTSRRFRISKSLVGSHVGVAAKIGEEYLKIQPSKAAAGETMNKGLLQLEPYWERIDLQERDENYKFVIPNWTVNYTMNWLCNQSIGDITNIEERKKALGSITFWYQSAYGGYKLQSLNDMLEDKYLFGEPFIYSPVSENETIEKTRTHTTTIDDKTQETTTTDSIAGQKIINYQEGEHADFLEGIVYGIFAGEQTTVDFRNKVYWETEWSYFDSPSTGSSTNNPGLVKQSNTSFPILRSAKENYWIGVPVDFDENTGMFPPAGELIAKPFLRSSQLTSDHDANQPASSFKEAYSTLEFQTPRIFGERKSSGEAAAFYPKINLVRQAAMKLLKYNTITCQISARTDISAGKVIQLYIPAPDTGLSPDSGISEREDNFNSGSHLITEVMWSLMPTELKTNITCMRDTVLKPVEDVFEAIKEKMVNELEGEAS